MCNSSLSNSQRASIEIINFRRLLRDMYESIKPRRRDRAMPLRNMDERRNIWTSAQERKKEKKEGDETKYEEQKKVLAISLVISLSFLTFDRGYFR